MRSKRYAAVFLMPILKMWFWRFGEKMGILGGPQWSFAVSVLRKGMR